MKQEYDSYLDSKKKIAQGIIVYKLVDRENNITNETIMPDGRPFFAWKNELEMNRSIIEENKKAILETAIFQQAMRLIYKQWQEPQDLKWHFTIEHIDALSSPDFKYNLEKYLNKEPIK